MGLRDPVVDRVFRLSLESLRTMRVLVAGSHGQVGQHITELLSQSDHDVRGMVRDEAQVSDIETLGAEAVVADLTADVAHAVQGCDAVVFAAGSGGDDVWGVDRDGAINLIETAEAHDIYRFVMLSSINADTPEESPEALRDYLNAKAEADEHLRNRDLTYTIVRPGPLTNDAGTGRIKTGADLDRDGEIPRVDVARTLVTSLSMESTHGLTFEVLAGNEPIEDALEHPMNDQ
jgi:uncharacterized protein YbjT (DUF2867 family)